MIPFAASASVTVPGRRFWRSQIVFAIIAWRAAPLFFLGALGWKKF
jgi:DNA-binding transcriptional regulator of glucitol operon